MGSDEMVVDKVLVVVLELRLDAELSERLRERVKKRDHEGGGWEDEWFGDLYGGG